MTYTLSEEIVALWLILVHLKCSGLHFPILENVRDDDSSLIEAVTKVLWYRGWLVQHRLCCNKNTRSSFSGTRPGFSNTCLSFLNSWLSLWLYCKDAKSRLNSNPHPWVLRKAHGQVFHQGEFMKICCVKSTAYSLETLTVTSQFIALVTYVKYLNIDLMINIWKRQKSREKKVI